MCILTKKIERLMKSKSVLRELPSGEALRIHLGLSPGNGRTERNRGLKEDEQRLEELNFCARQTHRHLRIRVEYRRSSERRARARGACRWRCAAPRFRSNS